MYRRVMRLLEAGAAGDAWLLLQALGDRAGDSDPLKSSSFYAVGVASCNLAMIGLAGVGAPWVMLAAEVAMARWDRLPAPPPDIDGDLGNEEGDSGLEDHYEQEF